MRYRVQDSTADELKSQGYEAVKESNSRYSITKDGDEKYVCEKKGSKWKCSCPGFVHRGKCKHLSLLEVAPSELEEAKRYVSRAKDVIREKEKERKRKEAEKIEEFTSQKNLKTIANSVSEALKDKYDVSSEISGKSKVTVITNDSTGDKFKLELWSDNSKVEFRLLISRPSWWHTTVKAGLGDRSLIRDLEYSNSSLVKDIMSWYDVSFDKSKSEKLRMM